MFDIRKQMVVGVAAVALLLGGCAGTADGIVSRVQAAGATQNVLEMGDEAEDTAEGADVPITGNALEQASKAALDYLGEGKVTDTEVGDEEGFYEVEVTLDNGTEVDVHLDENFQVLGQESDHQGDDD